MKNYLTIDELNQLGFFDGAALYFNGVGDNNRANAMLSIETPDGIHWLKGKEIILTTGYAFEQEKKYKKEILRVASQKGVAAIGIKENRYFQNLSDFIEEAREFDIPIFILPQDTVYSDWIGRFYELLFNKENQNLMKKNASYFELLMLNNETNDINQIVDRVSIITHLNIDFLRFFELKESKSLKYPIIYKENEVGFLTVEGRKNLTEFQESCINYALVLIKSIIVNEQNNFLSQSINHRLLTEILLKSDNLDSKFFSHVKSYLGWKNNGFFACFFRWIDGTKAPNAKVRKIIETEKKEKFLFTETKNGLVVYLPFNRSELLRLLLKIKNSILGKTGQNMRIGVSSCLTKLTELKIGLTESMRASIISNKKPIFIDDFPQEKILLSLLENDEVRGYLFTVIKDLVIHDKKNGSHLLETLESYFQHNLIKKDTADSLYIHTETLRYRLNQVKEISGYDPSISHDLEFLMLAISLKDYL